MRKTYFNDKISSESISKMIMCFQPQYKKYQRGETILTYSDKIANVAVLLSGKARLYYLDSDGNSSLLEVYEEGDIFGEVFSLPLEGYEYLVTADTRCKVVYIDYNHIISPCYKSCPHHSQLINNLFIMAAQKSQELSFHISILNQHTTRNKLMAYLYHARNTCGVTGTQSFELPISLGQLAEYLCVDRSAMMREIRNLKKDGLINSDRRTFALLN